MEDARGGPRNVDQARQEAAERLQHARKEADLCGQPVRKPCDWRA